MGIIFSSFYNLLFGDREVRLLILGLDNAGKTSILQKLHNSAAEVKSTLPTIGFNVETVKHGNVMFSAWDLGGQEKIRPYWRCYFPNTDAIIYVVDSVDSARIGISTQELVSMLNEEELRGVPLLVFANKQDMPNVMSEGQIAEALGLAKLTDRQWHIEKSCAIRGDGLDSGMDWLAKCISNK